MRTAAGGFFDLALQGNGTIIAWGDNTYGQTNVPAGITNAVSIAAGQYHGLALLNDGSVRSWGKYSDGMNFYSVTNYSGLSGPPTSNVMAIAAGFGHDLALMSNGTVVAWGLTNLYATTSNALAFQSNLTGVAAIACGWNHNVVLLSNGVVQAWGLNGSILGWNLTNVPSGLTNVAAISAFGLHSLALFSNGTVAAWGYSPGGETNVPAGLSNVVAIAAGGLQSLALQADGTVVAWGMAGLANVPQGLTAAKVISSGFEHNLVLQSGLRTPVITEEPLDQYAPAGSNVTFTVQAESLAEVAYQWQFNNVNLTGATTSNLTLTNVQATNNGSYQVIVSAGGTSISSIVANFTLVLAPEIFASFTAPTNLWINTATNLNAGVNAIDPSQYPVGYQWTLNGTNISTSPSNYTVYPMATADGNYTLVVTNIAGSNSVTWDIRVALPGMVEAWGSDTNGECDRPATLTNATAIAAGDYHSVAVTDNGTILQWGKYSDGTNFYAVGSPPALTNVVAVAATRGHDLALSADGTVTNWGLTNDFANFVPANLQPAKAIAAGWYHNIALLTNGTVIGWGSDTNGQTTIPSDLTNANAATAIAAGELFSLALRCNGTVEGWGDNTYGQTSVPSNLTGVVAIAAGGQHSLALQSNGIVVAWGDNEYGQTNVPSGMSNVMAIAAGDQHSVALQNDGTLVAWGDNSLGQTNVPAELPTIVIITNVTPSTNGIPAVTNWQTNTYPPVVVKLIAAGGNHTMAAIFSPWVQYPVDVSKDLLLIYNSNSIDSFNVCQYYTNNRPMASNANVLGIGCTNSEQINLPDFTNNIQQPIQNWLSANPTKRPTYVILFQDIPSRTYLVVGTNTLTKPSVQVLINTTCAANWQPFVTSINMNGSGGTSDCIAYINKLASIGSNYSPGQLIISASAGYGTTNHYGNMNWYFDDTEDGFAGDPLGMTAEQAVLQDGVSSNSILYTNSNPNCGSLACHITNGSNVAGYMSWGCHGYNCDTNGGYATNNTIHFTGQSGWYIMQTMESFNGMLSGCYDSCDGPICQGNFISWYAANAFGGTNYSNTPVGAVSNVAEPGLVGNNNSGVYFGLWGIGKNFGICAWNSRNSPYLQAVGDPLTTK